MKPKSPPLEKHPILNKVLPENTNIVRQKANRLLKVMAELMAEKYAKHQSENRREPDGSAQVKRYPLCRPSITEPNSDIKVDPNTGSNTPVPRESRKAAASPESFPAGSLTANQVASQTHNEFKMSLPFAQSPAQSLVQNQSPRPSNNLAAAKVASKENQDKNARDAAFSFFKFSATKPEPKPQDAKQIQSLRTLPPNGVCFSRSPQPLDFSIQPLLRPGSKIISEKRGPPIIRTVVHGNPGLKPPPVVLTREFPVIQNNIVIKNFDVKKEFPVVRENTLEKPCELLKEVLVENKYEKEIVTQKFVDHPKIVYLEKPVERVVFLPVERVHKQTVFIDKVVPVLVDHQGVKIAQQPDRLHSFSFSQRIPFRSLPHSNNRSSNAQDSVKKAQNAEPVMRVHSPQQNLAMFASPSPKRQLFVSELNISSPPSEPRKTPDSISSVEDSAGKSSTPSVIKTARFASRVITQTPTNARTQAKPDSMSTVTSLPPENTTSQTSIPNLVESDLTKTPAAQRRISYGTDTQSTSSKLAPAAV